MDIVHLNNWLKVSSRVFLSIFVLGLCSVLILPSIVLASSFKKNFIITGYYSPLPNQNHYVMGSYEADKRMNGNGTNGASGAEVFPGMLAAPKSYPFGYKINIPGVGIAEVQDRGGAIVDSGQRNNAYDRLDIWMGAGDVGLRRALLWGKRTVETTVYGIDENVVVTASFDTWSDNELEMVKYWKEHAPIVTNSNTSGIISTVTKLFNKDLWLGEQSEKVTEMQELLSGLGYLYKAADGNFDNETARAIYQFQRDNDIVVSWNDLGAGHFGPQTRSTIEQAKEALEKDEYVNQTVFLGKIQEYEDLKEEFTAFTNELHVGKKGENVESLQKEMVALGFLRADISGNYGEVTRNAVVHFQLKSGIIESEDDLGAGVVGPQTRAALNNIFDERIEAKGLIALQRENTTTSVDTVMIASNN